MIAWWGRCCTKISKSLYCDWAAAQIKDKERFEALSFLCPIWFTTIGGNNSVSVFDRLLFNPPSAVASGNDRKPPTPPDKVRQHVVWMIRGGVSKKAALTNRHWKQKDATRYWKAVTECPVHSHYFSPTYTLAYYSWFPPNASIVFSDFAFWRCLKALSQTFFPPLQFYSYFFPLFPLILLTPGPSHQITQRF